MPIYKQHKKTHRYGNEFKAKTVQMSLLDSVEAQAVAKTLDIHPQLSPFIVPVSSNKVS